MNSFIELKNLSKSFVEKKNVKVLKKINFKFKLGKIYSLMGPSGSGKSTLLNIISLIDRPSSGLIKFGQNFIDFNSKMIYLGQIILVLFISKIIYCQILQL